MSVDDEVRCDREWQAEHADDIFDDPVGCCRHHYVPAMPQRFRVGFGEPTESLQLTNALRDAETMETADS